MLIPADLLVKCCFGPRTHLLQYIDLSLKHEALAQKKKYQNHPHKSRHLNGDSESIDSPELGHVLQKPRNLRTC